MALLTVEKDEHRRSELTVKLDGVEIPMITQVEIISAVGATTKLKITCIVGIGRDGDGVLIKESDIRF